MSTMFVGVICFQTTIPTGAKERIVFYREQARNQFIFLIFLFCKYDGGNICHPPHFLWLRYDAGETCCVPYLARSTVNISTVRSGPPSLSPSLIGVEVRRSTAPVLTRLGWPSPDSFATCGMIFRFRACMKAVNSRPIAWYGYDVSLHRAIKQWRDGHEETRVMRYTRCVNNFVCCRRPFVADFVFVILKLRIFALPVCRMSKVGSQVE